MKIQYTKKRLRFNLAFGVVWGILGLAGIFFEEEGNWGMYGYLVVSILYFGLYFYQRANQYLNISNGNIKLNDLFGKKIAFNDIIQIKKFAGDYIIKTKNKELTINTQIIDPESLEDLHKVLAKIDLPADKTPFYRK